MDQKNDTLKEEEPLTQAAAFIKKLTGIEVEFVGAIAEGITLTKTVFLPVAQGEEHGFVLSGRWPDEIAVARIDNPVEFTRPEDRARKIDEAFREGVDADEPFYTGPGVMPEKIGIRVDYAIDDNDALRQLLEVEGYDDLDGEKIQNLVRLHDKPSKLGFSMFHCNWEISEGKVNVDITAKVEDWPKMVGETRVQYGECWGDQNWFPSSPENALYEIAVASNANVSPDEDGYAIMDWHKICVSDDPECVADNDELVP